MTKQNAIKQLEAERAVLDAIDETEWEYQLPHAWSDGTTVSVASLLDYEYEGANHEGGHAKQMKEHFSNKMNPPKGRSPIGD